MLEKLKKQWFVCLIAVMILGITLFVIISTNIGKLPGKSADGKDVVAALGETNILADDVFNEMMKTTGKDAVKMQFQIAVVENAIKTTPEMEKEAKENEKNIIANTKNSASQNQVDPTTGAPTTVDYKAQISSELVKMGFGEDDLLRFCIYQIKSNKMSDDYIKERLPELFTPVYESKKSRTVSHILIKMADSANPTAEETARVEKVNAELAAGKSFADVAKSFSEDPGSKAKSGFLGYVDSDNSAGFVESFANASMTLGNGEVSGWIKEANDNYNGWHLIKADTTDLNTLLETEDAEVFQGMKQAILATNTALQEQIIWSYTKDLKLEFKDEDVKKQIYETYNVSEDAEKE